MKKNILIVAQIPPPFHGQSIMQKYLVDASWEWCNKYHINLDFSGSINEVGKFNLNKILKIIKIIYKCVNLRIKIKNKFDAAYYPPASPYKIPFYRDVIILFFLRRISRRIIFHFHSGGFNLLPQKLNRAELMLAKHTYSNPDVAIALLPRLSEDISWTEPQKMISIPNGIPDVHDHYIAQFNDIPEILFISNIKEEKGIWTLLEAVRLLKNSYNYKLRIMGAWHSEELEKEVNFFILDNSLQEKIEILGVQLGDLKWKTFANSDIFCLPTYENEAMPITIIEAMMMSKPVVATDWRAIPDMVEDAVNGFLFPVKDSTALSQKLEILLGNKELSAQMGRAGRKKYLENYTIDAHLAKLENVFKEITQ